jgi:flagellar assembly protein FliH
MTFSRPFSPGQPLRRVEILAPGRARPAAESAESVARREEAAYQRGLADGERRLGDQLLRQRSEMLELQSGVLTSLRQVVPQVIRQTEAALTELALEVATRLVSGLPVSTEMVEAAVRAALAQVEETAQVRIQLNPEDLALLERGNSVLLQPGPGREGIRFEASSEVTRGGCLAQTRFGIIDARRETKLQLIRESIGA